MRRGWIGVMFLGLVSAVAVTSQRSADAQSCSHACAVEQRDAHGCCPTVAIPHITPTTGMPTTRVVPTATAIATSTTTNPNDPVVRAFLANKLTCDASPASGYECNLTGIGYETAKGTTTNYGMAVAYYNKACTAHLPDGCANLGALYDEGQGIAIDKVRADALFVEACNGGSSRGCNQLGLHYLYAKGGRAQDNTQASALFLKACDNTRDATSAAYACSNLGYMYANGLGVPRDYVKMIDVYTRSCNGGDPKGCFNLGVQYEKGEGVAQNDITATSLYRKGCDGGSAGACTGLGLLHEKGRAGTVADASVAATYYEKSCRGDYAYGCHNLGRLNEYGIGMNANPARAKTLYDKACRGGHADACTAFARIP